MIVSFFEGARSTDVRAADLSWEEFVEVLRSGARETECHPCKGKTCPAKMEGWAFAPAVYREGATRGADSVESVTMFAGDLDHLSPGQVASARETLAGLTHLLYSTHNHLRDGAGDACLRVVLPLSRPVPAADWRRFWLAFADLSGLPLDKVVKSTASLLFLPNRPSGRDLLFEVSEGAPLDVDAVLAHAPPQVIDAAPVTAPIPAGSQQNGVIDADARAALLSLGKLARTLAPGGQYGPQSLGRRMTCYNTGRLLGGYAAADRLPLEESLDLFARLAEPPLTPGGACEKALRDGARVGASAPVPPDGTLDAVAEALGRPRAPSVYDVEPWFWSQLESVCRGAPDTARPRSPRVDRRETVTLPDGTTDEVDVRDEEGEKYHADLKGDAALAGAFVVDRYWDAKLKLLTLRRWRGAWYHWTTREGCYKEVDQETLFSQVLQSPHSDGDVTDSGKILKALVAVHDDGGVLVPESVDLGTWLVGSGKSNPVSTVTCRNGLLDLETMALVPSTPHYFSTTCLGVAYDPGAPEPKRWLAFLRECFGDDAQATALLQQWFGYCVTPDTRQQKMLFMVGKKRSGKGTILNVLGYLLGKGSTVSPSLGSLNGEFGLWQLIGKSAAFFPDVRHSDRTDSTRMIETLLSVSGNDQISVNRKSLSFWNGRIGARIALATNALPDMRDSSDALVSRMMVLDMPASFFGREDKDLSAKLQEELPGILLWAVQGWRDLRAAGAFTQPESSKGAIATLNDLSSPVGAWLSACCVTEAPAGALALACEDAFQSYRQWCGTTGHKDVSLTRFGADVKARGFERVRDGSGSRVFRYASLFKRA